MLTHEHTGVAPEGHITDARPFAPDRVLVKYRSSAEGEKRPGALRHFRRSGLTLLNVSPRVGVENTLKKLRRDPAVLYAEPDYLVEALTVPDDYYYQYLWNLMDIDMPSAWDITMGSRDIVIAVIDTGIDYTHQDMADMLRSPAGPFQRSSGAAYGLRASISPSAPLPIPAGM